MSRNSDDELPFDRIDFDDRAGCYHVECDWRSGESLTDTIVASIVAISDKKRDNLATLDAVLNTDSLDEIFVPDDAGTPRKGGRLSFVFEEHEITIHRHGTIVIYPPEREWSGLRELRSRPSFDD
ncbi:HalOD1 output domain-containing protein [Halorussus halophilus]|uniref:HalOD1 output domain-containing protein n=1 Tax=Halorussus halophilus TaxID=2650975 RepID=UPI0013017FD4|nr:HalOD1 output domain-containing protein [Halorussus halophilus]